MILTKKEWSALRRALSALELNRGRFLLAVVFGSMGLGSAIALSAVSAWLIARASQMPPVLELSVAATSVRMFGIGKAVFRYLERLASHRVALSGMGRLRTNMYAALASSSDSRVAGIRRGDLLARTGADVDTIGDTVVKAIMPACVAFVTAFVSVGIVWFLSAPIAIALVVCLLISGLLGPVVAAVGARRAERSRVEDEAELSALSLALLEGAGELRISGRLAAMKEAVRRTESRIHSHRDRAAKPQAWAAAIDTMALALAVLGAIIIGVSQLEAGQLNGIELAVCVLVPLAAFEGTAALGPAALELVQSGQAATRIIDLIGEEEPLAKKRDLNLEPVIDARNLVVGWPGGPDVAGPFNLTVGRGSKIAIVGPSGVGKSTLLMTLAGLIKPHAGTVTLGGMEVSTLDRESISRALILIAEDSHIFQTTVMENLRVVRKDLTENEAREALTKAGLGDWLARLPGGLDTMLGQNATTVSGGERRRLLLARAHASHAPIIALDEPAEHLEPETADRLLGDLYESDLGVIVVTHRLTDLQRTDTVIHLGDDGVEIGAYDELMEHSPSFRWAVQEAQ
ncbi:thiol reductant ABC exporter subunit CydC [Flaviflexus huanghaiensis]|uniref:thiol reductant ABC exporter subunit CydC n=1 Tax=Flaviflexus huanghaiensis TaxID=1111473 RepID=UPI0015FB51A9|nr:thiol reductant ABC exporter subunit CydC [Flaviflexus huanghaiensis]